MIPPEPQLISDSRYLVAAGLAAKLNPLLSEPIPSLDSGHRNLLGVLSSPWVHALVVAMAIAPVTGSYVLQRPQLGRHSLETGYSGVELDIVYLPAYVPNQSDRLRISPQQELDSAAAVSEPPPAEPTPVRPTAPELFSVQ